MRRSLLSFLIPLLFLGHANAQVTPPAAPLPQYRFTLNLSQLRDDKLTIKLTTGKMDRDRVIYNIPKVVPGTYSVHDYGRYVSNFRASDDKGNPLEVKKRDTNRWEIAGAQTLSTISYEVDDTWDSPEMTGKNVIFEPAGTNFDKEVFVLNPFALFGYFDGFQSRRFEVEITKPAELYGATSLTDKDASPLVDRFETNSYQGLADAPIVYHQPENVTLSIQGTEFLISVYSPNKKVAAKSVAKALEPFLKAQKAYLGDAVPIKKYAFLVYLTDDQRVQKVGALEHSYSSVYYFPEFAPEAVLNEALADAAAHEFFHVLTPLKLHSEEIGSFDYINPRMSKHLWLYEGMTEYAAHHVQLKAGLISLTTYLNRQMEKRKAADNFNTKLSLTEMSANVLDKYNDQYANVYEKGALIGLCLDIKLRQLSDGKYGTQNLLQDLAARYGENTSFKDDELFAAITKLTYPEVGEFLEKYVAGTAPLPLRETLRSVGVEYVESRTGKQVRLFKELRIQDGGRIGLPAGADAEGAITQLGAALGLRPGDGFVSINGKDVNKNSFAGIVREVGGSAEGAPLTVVVSRKNEKGVPANVTLATKVFKEDVEYRHQFRILDDKLAGENALKLRNAWAGVAN